MTDIEFNTNPGETVARELLVAYLNTGTASAPVWSSIGKRVEESAEEMDWSEETKQDILGATWGALKKPTITQTFDPCELDADDAAQQKIWNLAVREQNAQVLASQDMLIVHLYAGKGGAAFAERYASCMVKPSSLGGEGGGNLGMPVDVTYGGKRTIGTASRAADGTVTFTPEGEVAE